MTELHQQLAEHELNIVKHLDTIAKPSIEIVRCVNNGWVVTTTRSVIVPEGGYPVIEKLIAEYTSTKKLINQT